MKFVCGQIGERNRVLNERCRRVGNLCENKVRGKSDTDREKDEDCPEAASDSMGSALGTSHTFFTMSAVKSF